VLSARTQSRVALDSVLENAFDAALGHEPNPDIRAVLASWGSAEDAIARLR
jgi:hypothetical protein